MSANIGVSANIEVGVHTLEWECKHWSESANIGVGVQKIGVGVQHAQLHKLFLFTTHYFSLQLLHIFGQLPCMFL